MGRSSRQRQTRLAFTPLPSSSPAAQGYHKQIQDRAAAVTLSSSPHSRRSIFNKDATKHTNSSLKHTMPTPASEDGLKVKDGQGDNSSDSEPVRRHSQQRKSGSHVKVRQRQIDFSNARDPSTFSPPKRLSSPFSSKPRSSTRAGMFNTHESNKAVVDISSDADSDDEELPSPHKLVAQRGKSPKRKDKAARVTRSQAVPEALDEQDDTIAVKAKSSPILVESDDDDEDDMPTTAGLKRRKRVARRSPDRDSFIASSPPQMTDSDDDLEIVEPPSKRRRRHRSDSNEDEDEDEDEVVAPTRKLSRREKNELDEDLDFLGPSSDIDASAHKPRSSQSASKSARQKALEALKRKRSGNRQPQARHTSIEDSEDEDAEDPDDEEMQDDSFERVQATRSLQMFREDEDDNGFIASDDGADDDVLGVPEGLPLEYTRHASRKAKDLFKFAVEWFVQKKMNPAFQMDDDIYNLTFRKLNDEVSALADSKFKSSAWRDEFIYTLDARPDIAFDSIDRSEPEHAMRDTCDACNRTGHPPTFQVQFLGRPYDRQTLENLAGNAVGDDDEDNSDSNSDDSNEPNWDADGHEIPPETKSWYLGKFCMSNARTAHALRHWRYHLNTWVLSWLDGKGYNTPDQVVKRDSMSTKRRKEYADQIVDVMTAQGVVKQLYRDYRNNIDDARNSKQGRHVSGWD